MITATIDEHEAVTLTYTHMNTTSNLGVPDAAGFADDLISTLNLEQGDIFRDGYSVLVTTEGVKVEVRPPFVPNPVAAHRLRGQPTARPQRLISAGNLATASVAE